MHAAATKLGSKSIIGAEVWSREAFQMACLRLGIRVGSYGRLRKGVGEIMVDQIQLRHPNERL